MTKALTGEGGPYFGRHRRGNWGKDGVGTERGGPPNKARQIFCEFVQKLAACRTFQPLHVNK